jgi:ferredoxin-nitrate reductase
MGLAMYYRIEAMADKYKDDTDWGQRRAHNLADTLLLYKMNDEQMNGSYQVLETLQALHVFLSHMKGNLGVMLPAA